MIEDNVLTVSNISKCYRTYKSNLHRFGSWFGFKSVPDSDFWAVRSISFDMPRGQSVGVIGQNGAGKSTFLKLVTGTVQPTEGKISVAGRVSAVLELGLGFNPEFTARQNVMTAGGMLGYRHAELASMMPWIEDFAELGDFFDKPLRVYSTGMQARLAFSLATARRPDILIVDEVLSVGDSYFQHKSFNRIRSFRDDGTSILLVTHSLTDVRTLCDRVILLDKGRVIKDGEPDEIVDYYNAMIAARENERALIQQKRTSTGWVTSRSGNYGATIDEIHLLDAETGVDVAVVRTTQRLSLEVNIRVTEPIKQLVLGFMIRDRGGHVVFGTNTWHTKQAIDDVASGSTYQFVIEFDCDLGPGSYGISTAIHSSDNHVMSNYEWQDNVLVFDVINVSHPTFIGTTFLETSFRIEQGVNRHG